MTKKQHIAEIGLYVVCVICCGIFTFMPPLVAPAQLPPLPAEIIGEPSIVNVNVTLAWNSSEDHDMIDHYNLLWGPQSGVYTNSINCGRELSGTITNLVIGATYYITTTATATNLLTSDFSNEVVYTVPAPPAPPGNIGVSNMKLLKIKIVGSTNVLDWTEVAAFDFVIKGGGQYGYFRAEMEMTSIPAITW